MPKRPSIGVKMVSVELEEELLSQAREYADQRGETFRAVVVRALRREMAYPPPDEPPAPLPDSPAAKGKKSR